MIAEQGTGSILAQARTSYLQKKCSRDEFLYRIACQYQALGKPCRAREALSAISAGTSSMIQLAASELMAQLLSTMDNTPGCSLNMIVKNESANIGKALDCVDSIMDEIVICDTGSEDDTVLIAELYGARIIRFEWCDDFSAARNAAIDASTGDSILWLDADDRMDPESAQRLANVWRSQPDVCSLFRIINQAQLGSANEFMQARMFPHRTGIRFERRIHEQIMATVKKAGIRFAQHPEIAIRHTGYDDASAHRAKAARNLAMITRELTGSPDDPSLQLSLGDSYMILEDFMSAIPAYQKVIAIENSYSINPDIYVQAHFFIALAYYRMGNMHEARRYLYRCLYLDPTRIEACGILGSIYKMQGDTLNAGEFFIRAACIEPPVRLTATDNKRMKVQAIFNLARIFTDQKKYSAVIELLSDAVLKFPNVIPFYNQLGGAYLEKMQILEAVKVFMESVRLAPANNPEPYAGMSRIYDILGEPEKARAFEARTQSLAGVI